MRVRFLAGFPFSLWVWMSPSFERWPFSFGLVVGAQHVGRGLVVLA